VAALCATIASALAGAQATSTTPGAASSGAQTPTSDPYVNNTAPGTQAFPPAAPAGRDSNAGTAAPAGAVNQGPFDPAAGK
jgi:hypothetical protein